MKKLITLVVLLAACSCKGGNSSNDFWEQISRTGEQVTSAQYVIRGKVSCPVCRSYDMMMITVESADGYFFTSSPWERTFEEGDYQIKDLRLIPDSNVIVRIAVGSVNPIGKEFEVTVPEEGDPIINVNAVLP